MSDEVDKQRPVGPRGGTTTVTRSGMVKKNLWIPREMAEGLREKAFGEHRSEAAIIREGLRLALELSGEPATGSSA